MLIKANIKNVRIKKPYNGLEDLRYIAGSIVSKHSRNKNIVLKAHLSVSEKEALWLDFLRETYKTEFFNISDYRFNWDKLPNTINFKGPFDNISFRIRLKHGSKNTFNKCN